MGYPSQQEIVGANPLDEWIDHHFLRPDPFAFDGADFQSIVREMTREFGVDPNGVFCIGSGAVGLSLNPGNVTNGALRDYTEGSDLDIAIISEVHFETAWRDLRDLAHPRSGPLDSKLAADLKWQRKKLFDGAIITTELLPHLSFASEWLPASARISQSVTRMLDREVDFHYWIYRDYRSVRSYVANSIFECRKRLIA